MLNVPEALDFDKCLEYSVFGDSSQRTIIAEYGIDSYDDILALGESDVVNLAKGFSDRTAAAGNISFVLRHTNLLKAIIHWFQEFRRISQTPSLIGISNAAKFHAAVETARHSASIRKHILEESSILSKAAYPGKLIWNK